MPTSPRHRNPSGGPQPQAGGRRSRVGKAICSSARPLEPAGPGRVSRFTAPPQPLPAPIGALNGVMLIGLPTTDLTGMMPPLIVDHHANTSDSQVSFAGLVLAAKHQLSPATMIGDQLRLVLPCGKWQLHVN